MHITYHLFASKVIISVPRGVSPCLGSGSFFQETPRAVPSPPKNLPSKGLPSADLAKHVSGCSTLSIFITSWAVHAVPLLLYYESFEIFVYFHIEIEDVGKLACSQHS